MKKVINGKTYNTETATAVKEFDNGRYSTDIMCCRATLYRRKTDGAYFLHGSGGAYSVFGAGNIDSIEGLHWGERIIPLTGAAADKLSKMSNDDFFAELTDGSLHCDMR